MATVVLTIGGTTKQFRAGTFHLTQTANGRSTLAFTVESTDGSYRPAQDAEVIVTEDGTRIFGGLLDQPREKGLVAGANAAIATAISAVDFNHYAERRYVNETLAAGTLKSMLTTLVTTYLSAYGVTLDAGQVNGPTLPEMVFKYRRVDDALSDLITLTADFGQPYVWRIDPFKVLKAHQPSTTAAPFNVVGTSLPIANVVGDIEIDSVRDKRYANKVIVTVPPKSEFGRQESFTGNGTQGPFTLQYTPTKLYGHILVQSGGAETLGNAGESPIQWSYDSVTNSISREAGATTNGEVYTLYFDGFYAGVGIASDAAEIAARGIWEKVIVVENVPSDTTAQAIADGELAKSIYVTQKVTYRTDTAGILPGQTQTINVPRRNINATAVISDVVIQDVGKNLLRRTVTAMTDGAQTNIGRGYRDVVKQWSSDKTGTGVGSVSTGTGGSAATAPGSPFTSVQFNREGAFGGDAQFTFDEYSDSIVCGGGGSSITATNAVSCQVFGHDNHIA
jgi:hypothetical protein